MITAVGLLDQGNVWFGQDIFGGDAANFTTDSNDQHRVGAKVKNRMGR